MLSHMECARAFHPAIYVTTTYHSSCKYRTCTQLIMMSSKIKKIMIKCANLKKLILIPPNNTFPYWVQIPCLKCRHVCYLLEP